MAYLSLNITIIVFITLVAAMPILYFRLALKPSIGEKEFRIWVISWYAVTLIAFFTFNFFLFLFASAVFIFFISKRGENKLALFCILLFAVPSYAEKISVLFTINFTRELSLILLLPLFKQYQKQDYLQKFGKLATDKLATSFLVLMFVLQFRGLYSPIKPSTWSEESRNAIYIFTEMFLPYFIASRYIKDFKQLTTVLIAFIFICSIVGSIGMFEAVKSWLLYGSLHDSLGIEFGIKAYLSRDGMLRASSSMDHSLVLGFVMLIALGFYLFISNFIKSNLLKIAGFLLLTGGLISPFARGSWLGAAVMFAVYFSIGNKKIRNIILMAIAAFLALPLLAIMPGGQKVLNLLPFIGNVDATNVDYRTRLFEQSLLVIKNYPIFGVYDARLEPEMQVMVQGQGIIDLVNYYLQVALGYGLVGLAIFVMLLFSTVLPLNKHLRNIKDQKSMLYLCGRSLLALLLGTFVTIATLSALNMINTVLFLLIGLTVSYIRIAKKAQPNNFGEDNIGVSDTAESTESIEAHAYPTSRIVKK